MLNFLRKIVPTSTMQSAIWQGESVEILLVLHWTTIFCVMVVVNWWLAREHSQHDHLQLPNLLHLVAQNFFHTIWYRASSSMMESPNRSMLGFVTFIVKQCLQWHSIQLDLLKCPHAFKAIKNIPKHKPDNCVW